MLKCAKAIFIGIVLASIGANPAVAKPQGLTIIAEGAKFFQYILQAKADRCFRILGCSAILDSGTRVELNGDYKIAIRNFRRVNEDPICIVQIEESDYRMSQQKSIRCTSD